MAQPLLSVEELSRLVDGEASPEEEKALRARLANCPVSRQLYESMKALTPTLCAALVENTSVDAFPAGEECLDAETLLLLSENKLPPKQLAAAESHAAGCPRCLRALLTEMRSQTSMTRANWKALPPEVAQHPKLGGIASRQPTAHSPHSGRKSERQAPNLPQPAPHQPAAADDADTVVPEFLHLLSSQKGAHRTFRSGAWALDVEIQPVDILTTNLQLQVSKNNIAARETELTVFEGAAQRKIFRGLSNRDGMAIVRKLRAGIYDLRVPAGLLHIRLRLE